MFIDKNKAMAVINKLAMILERAYNRTAIFPPITANPIMGAAKMLQYAPIFGRGSSLKPMPYVIYEEICDDCGLCIDECPLQAIRKEGDRYILDPEICTECGSCSDICPQDAIRGQ